MIEFVTTIFEKSLKNGTQLQHRYSVSSFVGKGSYGVVYLAIDQQTSKKVIIKQHRNKKGKDSKEMLKNEAEVLSFLKHPSIPRCLDFFQKGQKSFLVMDYVEGSNYEDLVLNEGRKYNEQKSLQIFSKVVNVVKYLHDNKLVHRDLRLPNIIEKDDKVFIIDFGLAVFLDNNQEIFRQEKEVSTKKNLYREMSYRSDFYALGHFLLFLLYSNFEPASKKEQSWEKELKIGYGTKKMIQKLLRLDKSYDHIDEIFKDVEVLLHKNDV